jgi:hypothetical protein
MASSLMSYLPQAEGFLPKWLLFVRSMHDEQPTLNQALMLLDLKSSTLTSNLHQISVVSIGNSVQAYLTLHYTQRIYSLTNVTPVHGRTFGTWTAMAALVRLYAAYHINESAWYQMAIATFLLAGWHFFSEWLYFGTTKWGSPLAGPALVSTCSLAWMVSQWGWYVR